MSTFAIVLSVLLLMFFAYRGYTVLLLAPIMAALAVILSGDTAQMLPIYTETFMRALGNYMLAFFPIFLLGALFGQLMADSGAATAIAKWIERSLGSRHAILTVVLACGILTYGGVSLFVVAFAIYPIAKSLFRDADIPKRLVAPDCAGFVHLHHDGAAGHAIDPERDSDLVFRHQHLLGAGPGTDWRCHHVHAGHLVAALAREGRARRRRGLWRARRQRRRPARHGGRSRHER